MKNWAWLVTLCTLVYACGGDDETTKPDACCLDSDAGRDAGNTEEDAAIPGSQAHGDWDKLAQYHDPGDGEWEVVAPEDLLEECKIDPDLLAAADENIAFPYAIVRYGKLCHEHYPDPAQVGVETVQENFSATKTLGATVVGLALTLSKDFERTGRKTGPLSEFDRVDHWLDEFSFNPEAHVAHVLAMVAHNPDLGVGKKMHAYDADGSVQINRLSDIVDTVIAQDRENLGTSVEDFAKRHLFTPLGMRDSAWAGEIFGYSWQSTLRDMARLGLLITHQGYWNGAQVVDPEWIYRMTRPSFEDSNTGYGYLTWLAASANFNFGGVILPGVMQQTPLDTCQPPAIFAEHPHGLSELPDCNYGTMHSCSQQFDVGIWGGIGLGGQVIAGHRGLDLVMVAKDAGQMAWLNVVWLAIREAVIAGDPEYAGDSTAFCDAYAAGNYAPDLP